MSDAPASDHPDVGALAELDEGTLTGSAATELRRHLSGCPACARHLAALQQLRADLAALPTEPMPAEVAARLDRALATERAGQAEPGRTATAAARTITAATDELAGRRRTRRWLRPAPGLVAASLIGLLLVAVGVGALRNTGGHDANTTSGSGTAGVAAPASAGPVRAVTSGRSYTAANLEANVRGVAAGAPPAATSRGVPGAQAPGGAATPQRLGGTPEPLARLRTKAGLAACLRELSAGADGRPLVVDYATYQGGPAMVVVYPGGPASYHVFVVGPRCAAANADLRQFANVPRRG